MLRKKVPNKKRIKLAASKPSRCWVRGYSKEAPSQPGD